MPASTLSSVPLLLRKGCWGCPRPSGFCRPPLTVTAWLSADSPSVNIISAYDCYLLHFYSKSFFLNGRSPARIPCKTLMDAALPLNGSDLSESSRPRGKGRPRTVETAAPSLVELLNLVRTGAAN